MGPTKETKGVKAKGKAADKTDAKTKKAVAKTTKGKFPFPLDKRGRDVSPRTLSVRVAQCVASH